MHQMAFPIFSGRQLILQHIQSRIGHTALGQKFHPMVKLGRGGALINPDFRTKLWQACKRDSGGACGVNCKPSISKEYCRENQCYGRLIS